MSNKQKKKGYTFEAYIRDDLKKNGINVIRMGQAFQPDLVVDGFGTIELKVWANGLKGIYDILGNNKCAVVKWQSVKARGKKPLVVMEYDLFMPVLKGYLEGIKR